MAVGRPTLYTEELALTICERLVEGESLRAICRDDEMPAISSVFKWLAANQAFSDHYARAKEEQAEALADEIVAISDEECTTVRADKHPATKADEDGNVEVVFDSTAVARNRLRIDARKWVAAKLKPKKYGDKVTQEISGPDGAPIAVTRVELVAPSDHGQD